MLRVNVTKQLGAMSLEIDFAASGTITALFGPSGSGKTSTLNMVSGLLCPEEGRIELGDEVLFDGHRRINIPPHRRRIGYVFQEKRLFPHLTVSQNLAFGRWASGMRRDLTHEN